MAQLKMLNTAPALPPSSTPLPIEEPRGEGGGGGMGLAQDCSTCGGENEEEGDTRLPLSAWSAEQIAHRIKQNEGDEALARLLYAGKGDLIAALSHISTLHIV